MALIQDDAPPSRFVAFRNALATYAIHVGIWLTQGLNVFLCGFPDESTSSRSWRCSAQSRKWAIARHLIDGIWRLLFRRRDHCFEAWTAERIRAQFPPELR